MHWIVGDNVRLEVTLSQHGHRVYSSLGRQRTMKTHPVNTQNLAAGFRATIAGSRALIIVDFARYTFRDSRWFVLHVVVVMVVLDFVRQSWPERVAIPSYGVALIMLGLFFANYVIELCRRGRTILREERIARGEESASRVERRRIQKQLVKQSKRRRQRA